MRRRRRFVVVRCVGRWAEHFEFAVRAVRAEKVAAVVAAVGAEEVVAVVAAVGAVGAIERNVGSAGDNGACSRRKVPGHNSFHVQYPLLCLS